MTIALGMTGDLRTGWIGSWSPGIGDPNVMGWITVVAYLWASYLCFAVHRAWRSSDRDGGSPLFQRRFV